MEVTVINSIKNNNSNKKNSELKRKMNVCAYARVSTDDDDQINSYQSQIEYYSNLIKSNPQWNYVGTYADEGISGTQMKNRNDFLRMINDCKSKKIDIIISKSISRFARNTVDTLNTARELRKMNIDIYFEKENIHTLELDTEIFLTLYSAFAQAESESTSMNVKIGNRNKMKRGEPCGTIACYGFNWDPKNKEILINEKEANVVRKIFDLYLQGIGTSRICKILENEKIPSAKGGSKWHASVVKMIIQNEKYVGDLLGQKWYVPDVLTHRSVPNRGEKDKFYVKNHHVAIVSREIFDKAQEIYSNRSKKIKEGKEYCEKFSMRYPLSSVIYCGNCGNPFIRRVTHHRNKNQELIKYVYWVCSCNKNRKGYCDKNLPIREIDIEELFIELFNKLKTKYENESNFFEKIEKYILKNNPEKEIIKIEKQENVIESKISKLLDLKLNNSLDDNLFNEKYTELKQEQDELKIIKEKLNNGNIDTDNQKEQLKHIENSLKTFKIKKFDVEIFKRIVKKVIVGGIGENQIYNSNLVRFIINTPENDENYSFSSSGCCERTYSSKTNL